MPLFCIPADAATPTPATPSNATVADEPPKGETRSRPPDTFEPSGLSEYELAIFFDDLHRTAEVMQPVAWRRKLEEACGRSCLLVSTSRNGEDWKRVEKEQEHLLNVLGRYSIVHTSKFVDDWGEEKGEDLSAEEARQLASALGLSEEGVDRRFDGTPGSLLLDLNSMKDRYTRLRNERWGNVSMSRVLDSAKLLNQARLSSLREPILRNVAERVRGNASMSDETWDALRRRTQQEGFGRFDQEGLLRVYRPYLEQCVAYEPSRQDIDALLPILLEAEDATGLLELGSTYDFELGDIERALVCTDEALRLDPAQAEAYLNKGSALGKLGRYQEELQAYDRALSLRPDDPTFVSMVLTNKAVNLTNQQHYGDARRLIDQAIELMPDYSDAWYNKGIIQ
jgi:tetratricopeptide (TPR) repeat protein